MSDLHNWKELSIEIEQFKIKPGDMIVIKGEILATEFERLAHWMGKRHPKVLLVNLGREAEVEQLDEEEMRAAGWIRRS